MRVLLVEDEPLIAIDLETILDRLGHQVVGVAQTRDEAMRIAGDTRPDVALVDIKLRDGFTGIDTAREMRRDFSLHCALVTGNPEQLQDDDIEVVSKPFTVASIAAALAAKP